MAIAAVGGQSDAVGNAGVNVASVTLTLTNDVGSGNAIVVACGTLHSTASESIDSIADEGSNTYTSALYNEADGAKIEIWRAVNCSQKGGGSFEITVTFKSGSGDYPYVACQEVSGMATSSELDDTGQADNSSTTDFGSGTVTATSGGAVFAAMSRDDFANRSITEDGGYTLIAEYENGATYTPFSLIALYNTSATDYSPGWTIGASSNGPGISTAFAAAAVGGLSVPVAMHHLKQQGIS